MAPSKSGASVWYLYHSGFALKTQNHFLIFDYYSDTPAGKARSLDTGVINPGEIAAEHVLVFSSHSHGDHFTPRIFDWQKGIPDIGYVLSYDIRSLKKPADALSIHPGGEYQVGDVHITALQSTDKGVAFVIDVDGLCVYHAGDLNWWHWEGEPDNENRQMAGDYKKEIDTLKGKHIDIAFVPLDPRLEKDYLRGLDYLAHNADLATVFPMHFGSDYSVFSWIKNDARAAAYLDKVKTIPRRGEKFEV
ncbi:MAG: MBL fold metallo-hydrolase, partial [Eubacteriales bacterium]